MPQIINVSPSGMPPHWSRTQLICFQGLSTRRRDATNNVFTQWYATMFEQNTVILLPRTQYQET